jgi:hypothetical protein
MTLDELAAIPSIARRISAEAKEGYHWNADWGMYFENDSLFRERLSVTHEWRGPTHDGETGPA